MTIDRDGAGVRRTALIELFELADRRQKLELRVVLPATVTKFIPPAVGPYGPLPAMVEVEVDLEAARPGRAGDIDLSVPERFKPVPGALAGEGELVGRVPPFTCPVAFPGFGAGYLRGPLLPGEQGTVHFSDRALGRWLVAGRLGGLVVDPGEGATHGENLCDAFFMPGARSGPQQKVGSIPAEGVTLGTEDPADPMQHLLHLGAPETSLTTTAPTLTLDGAAEVRVGAGAVDLLAKADPLVQILTQFAADIGAWVPVTEAALKAALMLPTGTVGKILALVSQISTIKAKGE